ncbi:hypothetical protein [Cerasicoccus fimbriatus]|uniref:hypothetical protein n=1 Tax=Cerasicoccus fimbriatus TaxID=3014554 RepID=UPI0022B45644|nr:hypothetical protein [Cerasicoccus sp. TK19100]
MEIFRVLPDNDFQCLMPCNSKFADEQGSFVFDGTERRDRWGDYEFYVSTPLSRRGNFFGMISDKFVFDEHVYESDLLDILERAGEVLPAKLADTGENLYFLNVTYCINALDVENSYIERSPVFKHTPGMIRRHSFYPSRLGDAVPFKLPQTVRTHIYCDTGRMSEDDEFYTQYHNLGFTGLEFESLWTGSE